MTSSDDEEIRRNVYEVYKTGGCGLAMHRAEPAELWGYIFISQTNTPLNRGWGMPCRNVLILQRAPEPCLLSRTKEK